MASFTMPLVGIETLNQLESTIIQLLVGNSVASNVSRLAIDQFPSDDESGKEWIVSRREFLRENTMYSIFSCSFFQFIAL